MPKILTFLLVILFSLQVQAADNSYVVLNTQSLIYHQPQCMWAKRCTRNCVKVKKNQAIEKGARPCKVCWNDDKEENVERIESNKLNLLNNAISYQKQLIIIN